MTGSRHALIVGSAPIPGAEPWYASAILAAGLLIAADGGLELCLDAGRVPEYCVGDFDSVSAEALERASALGSRIVRHPTSKDESDLDLAVTLARDEGAQRITLTAAFSRRLDHTLAALGTVARAADMRAEVAEPDWHGYALDAISRPRLGLHEAEGTVLSLMAIGGPARVSIDGVAYPLDAALVAPLSSLGLSNLAMAGRQHFTVHEGTALVLVNVM